MPARGFPFKGYTRDYKGTIRVPLKGSTTLNRISQRPLAQAVPAAGDHVVHGEDHQQARHDLHDLSLGAFLRWHRVEGLGFRDV